MNKKELHSFHIPVLGLACSIDMPIKVARFGISSVMSIMDDQLVENMRKYHSMQVGAAYLAISDREDDHRAMRITVYLDLVNNIVTQQVAQMRLLPFSGNNDLMKYFELLPGTSSVKKVFQHMDGLEPGVEKQRLQDELRKAVVPGSIDVNIMVKVDKINFDKKGDPLSDEHSDALAAFRGYANSTLNSSVVFSQAMI